jgi:signal transduction histidine kinase
VIQKERFLLDEQIRRVLLTYESRWEEKNLTIDLNMESIMFYGNQSLLAQVWSNLLDNAIKFSNQNGILSVDCLATGNNVVVTVKDTGIGMEEDVKKHAFDKFYQGERSHHVKGNGLGLALVKRIVELCGGTVSLKSEKGIGTAILQKCIEWSKKRNCKRLKIETQNINVNACKFYMKQGATLGSVNRYAYKDKPGVIQFIWDIEL